MKKFQSNILGCIRKYNDYLGAKKWLQRAVTELDDMCYIELIDSIEPELIKNQLLHHYVSKKVSLEETGDVLIKIEDLLHNNEFELADQYAVFAIDHIDPLSYQELKSNYINYCQKELDKEEDKRTLENKMFGTQFSGLKVELQIDYKSYIDHIETPALNKYALEKFNIYLTKSLLPDIILSSNKNGSYRFLSWDDERAKSLIQANIGDNISFPGHFKSEGSNELEIIGNFTPDGNDLTHIQYETKSKKGYFESAINTLSNNNEKILTKISIDGFVNMKEVIPTGDQGKAIYAENNYIIDGAAGTGKTTTVIQKIRILTKRKDIDAKRIVIVAKNKNVKLQFLTLLDHLGIEGLKIRTVDDFLLENDEINLAGIDVDFLEKVELELLSYSQVFHKALNDKRRTSIEKISDDDSANIFDKFGNNPAFISELKKYDKLCVDLLGNRNKLSKYKISLDNKVESKLKDIKRTIIEGEIKRIKKTKYEGGSYNLLGNEIGIDQVSKSFIDSIPITSTPLINEFKNEFKNELDNLDRSVKRTRDSLKIVKSKLVSIFYSNEFMVMLFPNKLECKVALLYANKENKSIRKIHTLIVDEAQDVSISNIELFRLISENIILVGDEAQRENINGIGRWSKIMNNKKFFKSESEGIYRLKHNFRQTYELGVVSYNYRQLILGHKIEDIKSEYFENQIGFNIPELLYIKKTNEILTIVLKKLKYINDSFTRKFPLVLVYEKNGKNFEKMFDLEKISYTQNPQNEAVDVLLIDSNAIAGREFPVMLVNISANTADENIYIMLSRARFDLTVLVNAKHQVSSNIEILLDNGMIKNNIVN